MEHAFLLQIEDAALNAYPAPRQMVYDGWLLRFTGGDSKRVNAINVRYKSTIPLAEKIRTCERVYASQGLPVIFRLPDPCTPPALPSSLTATGYYPFDPTWVLGREISRVRAARLANGQIRHLSVPDWIRLRGELSPKSQDDLARHQIILESIVPSTALLGLFVEDQPVACGIAVIEGRLLGFFSIYTRIEDRRKGFASEMMAALTNWGIEKGAHFGYLQVEGDNLPALGLYEKLGFEKSYQYVYWKKK